MDDTSDSYAVDPPKDRRLFVYNGGFFTQKRVKRILSLSGYSVQLGAPSADDLVGVWGNSPTAYRGEAVAEHRRAGLVRVEDAWLRSLFPGRGGEPPCGLVIDTKGVHYNPSSASDLETLLATHPLDDTAMLDRARDAIARMKESHLTKYAAVDPACPLPPPGYVLVIDQTKGDASVEACGADRNRFLEMLFVAQEENPGAPVIIKTHPETQTGHRDGHYTQQDLAPHISMLDEPVSPWALMEGAIAVYTVSSQMGFEAIFADHKPRVFGAPFYAGWGLTQDEFPIQRRQRQITRAQLFMAAMLLYPKWYDPHSDTLCSFETALENLAAQARAWREDWYGWVASGMRLWKREPMQKFFGSVVPVVFEDDPAKARATGRPWMVWAGKAAVGQADAQRVEDGFLRSRGLGADLIAPLSLVIDSDGIYYDPSQPSHLETLIAERATLRGDQTRRAQHLIRQIIDRGLSKYNLTGTSPAVADGHRILVVGQVEDDASVLQGCSEVRTNAELLQVARDANPDAIVIYKPHPDVEAGLRSSAPVPLELADVVATGADPHALLQKVDEVWTMTSLMGFEALLRGVPVTTLGVPFYAGWGLTRDLARVPPRRRAQTSLEGLVHAALIDYPRYVHPDTGKPCPVEAAADWLATHEHAPPSGWGNRVLSKLQGIFASKAHLWR